MCSCWLTKEDQTVPCCDPEGIDGLSVLPSSPCPRSPSSIQPGAIGPCPRDVADMPVSSPVSVWMPWTHTVGWTNVHVPENTYPTQPGFRGSGCSAGKQHSVKFYYITVCLSPGNQKYNKTQVLPTCSSYYSKYLPNFIRPFIGFQSWNYSSRLLNKMR